MDFETMRQIRNQVRDFMTKDTAEISAEQQQRWSRDPTIGFTTVPYLYLLLPATRVGYGIRRQDPITADRWWLTGALLEQYRGRGLGEQLFRHLIADLPAGAGAALEVRISNLPARRLYEKLGFVEIQRRADILVLTREN